MQILPQEQSFGGALGTGLGRGLEMLAQYKLKKALEHHGGNAFKGTGLDFIKDWSEKERAQFLGSITKEQGLDAVKELMKPIQKPATQSIGTQPQPIGNQPQQIGYQKPPVGNQPQPIGNQPQPIGNQPQQMGTQQQAQPQGQPQPQQPQERINLKPITEANKNESWAILQRPAAGERGEREQKRATEEQDKLRTSFQKWNDKIDEERTSAEEMIQRAEDQIDLVKTGKLTPPEEYLNYKAWEEKGHMYGGAIGAGLGGAAGAVLGSLVPGAGTALAAAGGAAGGTALGGAAGAYLGITPKFLGTPIDQAFMKDFAQNMKFVRDALGAGESASVIESFMQGFASLGMSDAAKTKLLNESKKLSEFKITYANARDRIIKEHGGYIPKNLKELVYNETRDEWALTKKHLKENVDLLKKQVERDERIANHRATQDVKEYKKLLRQGKKAEHAAGATGSWEKKREYGLKEKQQFNELQQQLGAMLPF
jgi:hypothetical protein